MKIGTPIKVEWVDITGVNQWFDLEEIEEKIKEIDKIVYITYGFFYRKTNEKLYIASSIAFNGDKIDLVSDFNDIPIGAIKKITRL